METLTETEAKMIRSMREHPELKARFKEMLSLVENSKGDIIKADDAERRVTEELRQLGNEVLTAWAGRRVERVEGDHEAMLDCSRVGKKNSGGIAPTE